MRFLIVNTDYPEFLADLYSRNPGLAEASYAEQIQARYDSLFSVADFYSHNLRALGHEAWDLFANNEPLQRAWAREHGLSLRPSVRPQWRLRRGLVPWRFTVPDSSWYETVLKAQIEHYRPDVLINQNAFTIGDTIMHMARPRVTLLMVQHAATVPPGDHDWSVYDLAISSFPPTLERFRELGLRAEFHRLGFEPRVLRSIGERRRSIEVSFVGSFQGAHSSRAVWLRRVAANAPVSIWTSMPEALAEDSHVRLSVKGPAWGRAMYEVLASSKITLNHHGDVGPYANNLRLFEATGVGALLVTDWKPNLTDYFDVGKEVVAYRSEEECSELVAYYLAHEDERVTIAAAGQSRTLTEHNWRHRMRELVDIVARYA
ncbi:MAG: glycosyltransferase [Chthonomonadales bacterium]|nr:glycosyltransferase [Chthonomonadales bacterium]